MTLQSLVNEIREAEKKATEGPWEFRYPEIEDANGDDALETHCGCDDDPGNSNHQLIVLLRNKISTLLDAAEAGLALREAVGRPIDYHGPDGKICEMPVDAVVAYDRAVGKGV